MTVGTVLLVSFYDIEDHFRSGSFWKSLLSDKRAE